MESCARVIEMLPEYVEEELGLEAFRRVGSHLEVCHPCCRRVESHRRALEALEALPHVMPPAELRLAVMRRVRRHPLPSSRSTRSHLRLLTPFFWAAFVGMAALTSGAGALLLARASWGRSSLTDPTFLTEWLIALGQTAFSFLLSVATRSELPSLFSSSRSLFVWQGVAGWLLVIGASCLVMGFGLFATARVVFRTRNR